MALSYYITAREQLKFPGGPNASEEALREKVQAAFLAGVDTVQVREKDLPDARLARLVEELRTLRDKTAAGKPSAGKPVPEKAASRLLVNERLDIAVSSGADGVHLPSDSLPLAAVRSRVGPAGIVGISCHAEEEVEQAARDGASYVLFGPVFATPSKPGGKPLGIPLLARICRRSPVPVLALGGVNRENAESCVRAGAAGIAGIRLFQRDPDLAGLCRYLRGL